jgi:EAL domain-containing protein (putative c-di-GMP-specific phosphodiesterase class I)
MPGCYLEGFLGDGDSVYRIPITRFPALVGRESGLAVTLQSSNVSRQHAEFVQHDGELLLRDLGSTNGTFVNHLPVTGSTRISPGDVIRFADVEFRLRQERPASRSCGSDATVTSFFVPDGSADRMPAGAEYLDQLLRDRLIKPLFQPILSADDERIAGLELLGRGCHPELSELPLPLFTLADGLGRAIDLSEAIREVGVQAWSQSAFAGFPLFVNTQPRELNDCGRLVESLRTLRTLCRDGALVLEIHEQAVTGPASLSMLNAALNELNIGLAYDDFGAGQARLLELLDVPSYAVKFDISLLRDLDRQPVQRQEMIGLLVRLVQKGRALALAEGVSRTGELTVCRQLGFDLIQGYVYGQPASLEALAASTHFPSVSE